MIELEHSPLGGSAAHRFINCAGSFLLQRAQIENGEFENLESEYAKVGSAAHEAGAIAILNQVEPYELLGEDFNGYLVGWPDGISLDALTIYFNECMDLLNRYGGPDTTVLIEETIKLPDVHPLLKGTVDFGLLLRMVGLFIRDYKNGEGIGVGAANNRQLLYYAFLFILNDPWLRNEAPRDFPVSLGIVQPNHYGIFEEPDVWITTLGFVLDWGHEVLLPRMESLMRTKEVFDEDFVPGDHCQFCPVLLDCPKMQQAFEDYVNADEEFITMLTNEELDRYYGMREQARRFMKVLEETVRARMIATPGCITSSKLVEKKVARVWRPGAQAALVAAFGEKAFEPKEIKSPAQIEKLSSRGKEMALEWGYKPESAGLTIAPLSDPRPEAKPKTNASVFESHAQTNEQMGF